SGIWMSRNTRSGDSFLIAAIASVPFPHSPMISTPVSSRRNRLILSRANGSSSTMRVLSFTLSIFHLSRLVPILPIGDVEPYVQPVGFLGPKLELVPGAVQMLQPPPSIRKADALRKGLDAAGIHADSVIADAQMQAAVLPP